MHLHNEDIIAELLQTFPQSNTLSFWLTYDGLHLLQQEFWITETQQKLIFKIHITQRHLRLIIK